jgi:transcriptional regulator with GAF, ATPase, and Fis domain
MTTRDPNDSARLALEERLRFEALLADLSSQFVSIEPAEIDGAIEQAVGRLGQMLELDRGALTQLADDGRSLIFTHSWTASGIAPAPVRVDAGTLMPYGLAKLMRGEVHAISSLDDLPPGAPDRAFLAERGVTSALAIPLAAGGRMLGTLGFSATGAERVWDDSIVRRLRLAGDVFASALARKRADEELRRANDDRIGFEALIADIASQFVNLDSELVDRTVEDAQRRLVVALDIDRSALFEFDAAGCAVPTHFWSRPEFPGTPLERGVATTMFPWIAARLRSGETVCLARIDDLPAGVADREHLNFVGTKAMVALPLLVSGRIIGALTFGSMHAERDWPPDLVNRLTLVGQVFASAVARKRAEIELRHTLAENARLRDRLVEENIYLQHEVKSHMGPLAIVGHSSAMRGVLAEVARVAPTPATVLLLGETGTGKELIASTIHEQSPRSNRAMVCVNCAAIPATLIESELFGHEKGAFTGALTRKVGRFELADGSTLFLDEIGELTPDVQVKLLRVLQEREIERLGSSRPLPIDVRVIAATNRDLDQMIADGTFREDLYYRLSVFPIMVPPLRDRPDDIETLVWAFVDEFSRPLGKRIESISKERLVALQRYPWPGNVRELRNTVERAVIVSTGPRLEIEPPRNRVPRGPKSLRMKDVEREHAKAVLERTGWRIRGTAGAAEILGLKPSTLEDRMAKWGLQRPKA